MIIRVVVLFLVMIHCAMAQWNNWSDASTVRNNLLKAQKEGKIYFIQFHVYDARSEKNHFSSKFKDKTGEDLLIYGLDFYYASGTYFDSTYKAENRKRVVEIVKKMWKENRAIPSFSWHLENPYVPSSFSEYMGCRYRKSPKVPDYPQKHQFVIQEIIEGTGDVCGFGRFRSADDFTNVFNTPAKWFDARTREVADIINEFVDDAGNAIPMLFRLWHEQEDGWMWWGKNSVSVEDYKRFFIMTEMKIKQHAPKAQILWGYGPDSYWTSEDDFMSHYPGDEYVDIIGYDDYQLADPQKFPKALERARTVSEIAQKHGKIAALFESANKRPETADNYFEVSLQPILRDSLVHFGLVQMWSSGKFENENQYQDRRKFLDQDFILKVK